MLATVTPPHLGEMKWEGPADRETLGGGGVGEEPSELVAMLIWFEICDWISLAGEIHILGVADTAEELRRGRNNFSFINLRCTHMSTPH